MLVGSCSGVFFAIDRELGSEVWSYDTSQDGDPAQFHGDPLVAGDLVITGCDRSNRLHTYAFELATGLVAWKQPAAALESDVVGAGGLAIGRRWNGDLLALDPADGALAWSVPPADYTFPFEIDASPTAHGDTVFFGSVDGTIQAVDGRTGAVIWSHPTGDAVATAVAVAGDDVYAGLVGGEVLRLGRTDGGKLGLLRLADAPSGRPAVAGGAVMMIVGSGDLVALERDLSALRWRRNGIPRWSSPQPLLWKDFVVVGSATGTVHAFRTDTGEQAFEIPLEGMIRGLGAHGDVLYVGNFGGTLMACRVDATE